MVYGIFGDVQGQLNMLERVLSCLVAKCATFYVCLGDVVEGVPDPRAPHKEHQNPECVARVRDLLASGDGVSLKGNHDLDPDGGLDDGLSAWLERSLFTWRSEDVIAAHVLFTLPQMYKQKPPVLYGWYPHELEHICSFSSLKQIQNAFRDFIARTSYEFLVGTEKRFGMKPEEEYKEFLKKRRTLRLILLGHRHTPLLLRRRPGQPVEELLNMNLMAESEEWGFILEMEEGCSYLAIPARSRTATDSSTALKSAQQDS